MKQPDIYQRKRRYEILYRRARYEIIYWRGACVKENVSYRVAPVYNDVLATCLQSRKSEWKSVVGLEICTAVSLIGDVNRMQPREVKFLQ